MTYDRDKFKEMCSSHKAYCTVGVQLDLVSQLPYMERKKPNTEITTPYKEAQTSRLSQTTTAQQTHNLTTLVHHRRIFEVFLFHNILHGKVNCPNLLSPLSLRAPNKRNRLTSEECSGKIRQVTFLENSLFCTNFWYLS